MVFLVAQWVGENSISVLKDNQVNEKNIEEGATVSVTSKTRDKSIYEAVVLKVFRK